MRVSPRLLSVVAIVSVSAASLVAVPAPAGATVPGAPTIRAVSAGDHALSVSWNAGAGSATSFVARITGDHAKSCTASVGEYPPNTCTISGLENGRLYGVEVAAENGDGVGPFAASPAGITQMPTEVPGLASNLSAVVGSTVVKVDWTAPMPNTP